MEAVEIRGLKKSYGSFMVLRGIDLTVHEGEVLALLGPNGAGKTTLIRIIVEGLSYDSGDIRVFGRPLSKETARLIGYVPQESIAYDILTVRENMEFYADLYGASRDRIGGLIEEFNLPADKKAGNLSGGQKRKLNLAIALVYDPRLLILDEPSTGLDVPSRRELWDTIRGFKRRGISVLLATHYMEEAEALADRVAVINDGRIIAVGTPEELKRLAGGESVIHVEGHLRGVERLKAAFSRVLVKGNFIRVTVSEPRTALPKVLKVLLEEGSEVRLLRVEEPTLEDVFLKLTGRGLE